MGGGDHLAVKRAAVAVLLVGLGFSVIGSVMFAVIPEALGRLFLDTSQPDAQAVLELAVPLIMLGGAFQLFDGLQAVAAGLLRGLKDTKVPMILALISYWPIGFVFAWVFAFPLEWRGPGVWIGFVTGLTAAAILLCVRFRILVKRWG